jgi:hypothetical protein
MTIATQGHHYDVIVVGGGTAGTNAAVAAARLGARTCLVESTGYLGGTCLALANVIPFHNTRGERIVGGLPQEIVERLVERGGARAQPHLANPTGIGGSFTPVDPDALKLLLFELADEAGVELWLHTTFIDAIVESGTVRGVRVHNKSGFHALQAHVVIDATGDADVVVSAGGEFVQDVPEAALNATLLFRMGGVDTARFIEDVRRTPGKITLLADPYLRNVAGLDPATLVRERVHTIHDCPYIYLASLVRDYVPRRDWARWGLTGEDKASWGRLKPFGSRFSIMPLPGRDDTVTLNVTSITFDATDSAQASRAEVEGQRQLHVAQEVLRRYVPGFEGAFLHTVLPRLSVRASRRVLGQYQLTREDVEAGTRFDDGIARGAYPMSVQSRDEPNVRRHLFVRDGGDYDVPFRCLVPKALDGLLVAGRCMSATREAAGSTRMGAQCMAYGQAAGTAAALAARERVSPRDVDVRALRRTLADHDAVV